MYDWGMKHKKKCIDVKHIVGYKNIDAYQLFTLYRNI